MNYPFICAKNQMASSSIEATAFAQPFFTSVKSPSRHPFPRNWEMAEKQSRRPLAKHNEGRK
jgi:hypothetical protein